LTVVPCRRWSPPAVVAVAVAVAAAVVVVVVVVVAAAVVVVVVMGGGSCVLISDTAFSTAGRMKCLPATRSRLCRPCMARAAGVSLHACSAHTHTQAPVLPADVCGCCTRCTAIAVTRFAAAWKLKQSKVGAAKKKSNSKAAKEPMPPAIPSVDLVLQDLRRQAAGATMRVRAVLRCTGECCWIPV
jgi:hypothetical protein